MPMIASGEVSLNIQDVKKTNQQSLADWSFILQVMGLFPFDSCGWF